MKKFYSLLVIAVIALVSFQASAYSITLVFDNPEAIKSLTVYSDYGKSQIEQEYTPASSVVVEYTDDSKILDVVAADGYCLNKCVFQTTVTNTYFQDSYKSNHEIYLSSGYSGATYTYYTLNMDEARNNTATVTVNGDVSKVDLQFSGTYLKASLQEGVNTVKFMDSENTFTIGPKNYGQTLYSVYQNGTEVQKASEYSTSWTLTVNNGDEITINADFPKSPCAVTFDFAEEGTEDYITAVYLNQQPVENWQAGFEANGGDNLYFTVDSQKYKLNDFKVNDETKNLNGSYNTTVTGDALEFYFDVEPYGVCTATVTVDNPERLKYRVGYSGDYVAVPAATFPVEISENIASYTPVYFMPAAEDVYIASMIAGENTISKNYDGSFSTNITDGMQINITTGLIVRDKKAYFYFHNPDDANNYNKELYGYYFGNSTESNITLNQGYNELTFGDVDNPYKFQVNGNLNTVVPYVWFYKNGELIEHTNEYNAWWEMPYDNNDVIKVYIGSAINTPPTSQSIIYNISDFEKMPKIIYDYVVAASPVKAEPVMPLDESSETPTTPSSIYFDTMLPGTHVIVKPNGNKLVVKVNDEEVNADEEGNFVFDVADNENAESEISILSAVSSGVESINGATSNGNDRIYNLQGVEVSRENLPAGLYIMGGRKVIIR